MKSNTGEDWLSVEGTPYRSGQHCVQRCINLSERRRSIPLIMIWCNTPDASNRANLGMNTCLSFHKHNLNILRASLFNTQKVGDCIWRGLWGFRREGFWSYLNLSRFWKGNFSYWYGDFLVWLSLSVSEIPKESGIEQTRQTYSGEFRYLIQEFFFWRRPYKQSVWVNESSSVSALI